MGGFKFNTIIALNICQLLQKSDVLSNVSMNLYFMKCNCVQLSVQVYFPLGNNKVYLFSKNNDILLLEVAWRYWMCDVMYSVPFFKDSSEPEGCAPAFWYAIKLSQESVFVSCVESYVHQHTPIFVAYPWAAPSNHAPFSTPACDRKTTFQNKHGWDVALAYWMRLQ